MNYFYGKYNFSYCYKPGKRKSQVSLLAKDIENNYDSSFGTIVYTGSKELESCEIIFSFDPTKTNLNLSINLNGISKAKCLILCGIALAGRILDWYNKNRGNWGGFKDCLKGQGHALGTSTLACIAGCI